jgi:hypothetical protein
MRSDPAEISDPTETTIGRKLGKSPKFGLPPKLPVEHHRSAGLDSLNTIALSTAPIWTKYKRGHQIVLNDLVIVAQGTKPPRGRVLVRQINKENLDRKMRLLAQLRRTSFFLKASEVFRSGQTIYVVCEYVDLNLDHLLACPRVATEEEIAAIAGQVSRLCHFFQLPYADSS